MGYQTNAATGSGPVAPLHIYMLWRLSIRAGTGEARHFLQHRQSPKTGRGYITNDQAILSLSDPS